MGLYELGSVFKIFFAGLSSELGMSWYKKYDASNPIIIGPHKIKNFQEFFKIVLIT